MYNRVINKRLEILHFLHTVTINFLTFFLCFRCVVHGNSFYYGLLTPVAMILLGNWVVLVLALKGMRRAKILKRSRRRREQESYLWTHFLRAATCATILGLTWTFGILAVGYLKIVFQWIFCVLNSLQGFVIFMLFVVNNKEAKREIRKWYSGKKQLKLGSAAEISSMGKTSTGLPENEV